VQGVEVLAMTDALVGQNLGARADVVIVDVSTKLAAEQVHSEHAGHAPQHSGTRRETANKVSARGRRDDMPPADGSLTVAKIAADLRPSADGSAVRTSPVAGGG